MTRRERLERRAQKRQEWAEKADGRAAERFDAARRAVEGIEPGQPIIVGHHSEKMHRGALNRHDRAMRRGSEEAAKAKRHLRKADGIAHQLDRSIFSDDADAIEQLDAKVAALEAKRDTWKAWNAYWRKHGTMKGAPGISDEQAARLDAEIPQRVPGIASRSPSTSSPTSVLRSGGRRSASRRSRSAPPGPQRLRRRAVS